jgi:hypothetical protein
MLPGNGDSRLSPKAAFGTGTDALLTRAGGSAKIDAMQVSLHSNGKVVVQLTAETTIERAYLETIKQASGKGASVKIELVGGDEHSIAVTMEV